MFSKLKRWFDVKGKRAVALLATAALLCSFTGCAGNEASNAIPDSVTSALQSTPDAESKDSVSSQVNSDNTSSSDAQTEQNSGQSEFDFDEAVKNITLFGTKISLPCTIASFGDDFSLNTEPFEKALSSGENRVACNLLYKGKKIGTVAIADCTPEDDYNSRKIDTIMLGFSVDYSNWSEDYKKNYFQSSGWYQDLIEVELGGITFESSEEKVKSILGIPTIEQAYFEKGKELVYTFFQDDENHLVKSLVFRYQKNSLVGININFVEG